MQELPNLRDGQIFTHEGYTFRMNVERDDTPRTPWDDEGHGPVTDWIPRTDKRAGYRLLTSDGRSYGDGRYYDMKGATAKAKEEGWGLGPEALAKLEARLGRKATCGEIVAEAVERDYQYLRSWCNDEWAYCGVIVTPIPADCEDPDDVPTSYEYALWGIEDNETDYISEVAYQLAGDAVYDFNAEAAKEAEAREQEAAEAAWASQYGIPTLAGV